MSAFVIVITLSFVFLLGIVTTVIHYDIAEEKEDKLEKVASILSDRLEAEDYVDFNAYVTDESNLLPLIELIVGYDSQLNVMVADSQWNVLLTTQMPEGAESSDKTVYVSSDTELRRISEGELKAKGEGEGRYYYQEGTLGGIINEKSMVFGKEVICGDSETVGYVFAFCSTVREDSMLSLVKRAITNSCIVVMIAAMLSAYIITERLVRPLRIITDAAKSYGKGDFSQRIPVEGNDEVSELAESLNNMADSLDSLEKMRNSFLANVSHDLRTPMTTISGFIDGITSGAIPPEKHEYYLSVISAEVHRLSRLVTQLLDISRLESGERKFNFKSFNIAEMARIILISFEQRIDGKHLDVSFETESDEIYVNADEDAIYQVVYNLCHNAIKFSKDGGRFIIRIGHNSDKKVQVSVFDEGQGIPQEERKMVFDRFFKTDKSRGLDKNGVGLGLYICKTIIDAHDEKIWVESENDESCEFFFTLKSGVAPQKRGKSIVDGEFVN